MSIGDGIAVAGVALALASCVIVVAVLRAMAAGWFK